MPAGVEGIPSLDRLLRDDALAAPLTQFGRDEVTRALRVHLNALREQAQAGALDAAQLANNAIAAAITTEL